MENHLEAKSRMQGMLMGDRLRWQRWESSVLVTVPGAGTAEGLHKKAPYWHENGGSQISTLEAKGKRQKKGGAANHHSSAVAELSHHSTYLPAPPPAVCLQMWEQDEWHWESVLVILCCLPTFCEVLGCRKWTNERFFFIVLHIINLFLGQEVKQHTHRWNV